MSERPPAIAASDPAVSAWVSANAGSGKTYVLTNRVIRLLLDGATPDRLLCLTYTRAAAAEMRARVFGTLGRWTVLDDTTLAADIAEREGERPDAARLARARRLFAVALETPGGLKIQTIHAFCERLIGRFPVEANVPVPFEVLTDSDARALKREARIAALAELGDDAAREAMRALSPYVDADGFARLFDGPNAKTTAASDGDPWTALGLPRGLTPDDVVADGAFHSEDLIAFYRGAAAIHAQGSATDIKLSERIAGGLAITDPAERFEALAGAFFTQAGTRTKSIGTKKLRGAHGAFYAEFDAEIERASSLYERRRAAESALIVQSVVTLGGAISRAYDKAKRLHGVLDFDDLIAAALYLLRDSDAAQWALFKLDGGLDHILIDEAQDTSPDQWKVVERIAEEFFSGSGAQAARSARVRTLFAVGDEKQSIFSFQGADPAAFAAYRKEFGGKVEEAGWTFLTPILNTSRRSAPAVLQLVDAVFADEALRRAASETPWAGHIAHRETASGSVELWPLVEKEEEEASDPWLAAPDRVKESDPRVILAGHLAGAIKAWVGRESVEGEHGVRPMRAGDVLILVQRRGVLSQAIIRKLKGAAVPVAGADRLSLLSHIAVKDLIAYGRAALLPQDDLTLAALLKSPFFGLGEEELFTLAHGREGSLFQALRLSPSPAAQAALATLNLALNRLGRDAPFDFYARLLAGGGRAKILARLGEEAEDVIDEFLAAAAEYEERHAPSLEGFLHWLESAGGEVKRDPDEAGGAVRVLTAHGAKGLEAPVVILPDTTVLPRAQNAPNLLATADGPVWLPSGTPEADAAKEAWMARQDAEHKRLLYVALTRPRDRLVVCGVKAARQSKTGQTWYDAIQAGFALLGGDTIDTPAGPGTRFGGATEAGEPELPLAPVASPRPAWSLTPARHEEPIGVVRPSRLAPELSFGDTAAAFGLARGRLIHRLLQSLPDLPPERRAEAAQRYLAARGAEFEPEERTAIAERLIAILDDPRFAAAFAPGSRAEAQIAGRVTALGATGFISGQIDRLAVNEAGVFIVDYKTNRVPPSQPDETPSAYLKQMALYREAMRAAFPGRAVRCALLWTERPALMDLPDSLLDAALARLVTT
ncbi:RecBCD enzyme subunit RecB [Alphaproteobacteria bacterium SO-S41]|nr:RecBCD enzyme subunit RecB [Alphaproteobacteria bacterium SO-S41]